jgi:hypothetical protein
MEAPNGALKSIPVEQWSQIPIPFDKEQDPDPHL